MRKSYLKIILPTVLSILLFILTIFLIIIPRFQQNIMNGKREMIKELTNSAVSILAEYENDERKGLITREEAQRSAVSRIEYLRYGEENKDYFWITDLKPTMIIHPFRKDLNGTDLTNFTDPHGKKMFVEFVKTVQESEQGYVDYMWQWKDDSLHIVPKLSYVKIFKPWGWVIGTGVYIEDVKKEISALTERMIWISICISILMASLLLYIFKQSINTEQKRILAEKELHESKEKYRTLVEAATEGLLMIIDGKISFANIVISRITGYDINELTGMPVEKIISRSNNNDIIDTFTKGIIKEGQFEINLSSKTGGLLDVLVTSSTASFYEKNVNILIIKDISIDKTLKFTSLDYQKLITTLNIGFFKVKLDSRGRFLFANETVIRILGYKNFRQLSETNIVDLITESLERKDLMRELIKNGFIRDKFLKIRKPEGDNTLISLSMVVVKNGKEEDLICDGIIQDITFQENDRNRTDKLIAGLKAKELILMQPVRSYSRPLITADSDITLEDAINIMSRSDTDNILLTKNNKDIIGIITEDDIQKRIFALNLRLDNPSYLIMSSPVKFIREDNTITEAVRFCKENRISHPCIKNGSNEFTGILNLDELNNLLFDSISFHISDVLNSQNNNELSECYLNFRRLLVPLIKSEISIINVTSLTTYFSDSIIRRLIELTTREIGPPPARFAFLCLGSEGREEETLFTDQDNAIIYEDVPKEKENSVNEYFRKMGEKICNSLNTIGYTFCKGNIMAKNPQWCKPYSTWEEYFVRWISTPEPQNLLEASIFFDFRTVYGDTHFSEQLQSVISGSIKDNQLFLYHLAYNTFYTRPQHISSGNILSDRTSDTIDLKNATVPLTMFARTYSLQNNIWYTSTIERLGALKERAIIGSSTADEMIYIYNFLMKMRFRNQVELLKDSLPLSNILNTKGLIESELFILKKLLTSIPDFQNKIKSDFKVST